MKKLITALLAAAMSATLLAGCGSSLKGEEKGAVVNVYIGSEIIDFDPAIAFTDDSTVKVLGLVYEGLTRIGENGKVEKALMKEYEIFENEEKGEYSMQIEIKENKWSDGRAISADDIVYAWKRILDPEFSNAAAALLFDIKNARDVKMGDKSIDDLGVAAVDDTVLKIEFEEKIDYNLFLENLACLALVPLREDVVTRYAKLGESFGAESASMCSNGPFAVKGLDSDGLSLERNVYYYRETAKDKADPLDKSVLPYKLVVNFDADVEENTLAYENGEVFYLSEIALSKRSEYEKKAKVSDLLSTTCLVFNTENEKFADADVRSGLSMALDRNAIAEIVTFADPATGLVPPAVYDKKVGDSFRKNGGAILSASADADGAKALIGRATGEITITCRDDDVEIAIAESCKEAWEALGYKVNVNDLNLRRYRNAYEEGDYEVILLDYQSLSTDSFGVLAPFATLFSGKGIDIQNDNYDPVPYILGYENEEYNQLIEAAYAEKNRAARSEILHAAEELLLEDMPVIPVIFNKDAYVYNSKVLSGIDSYYYGFKDFTDLKMKNWRKYIETEAE